MSKRQVSIRRARGDAEIREAVHGALGGFGVVVAEGELMRHRWIVKLLFSDWFRRNVSFRLHPLLKRLRGGSYSWYLDGGAKGP
jgi:hypothetical protein